MSTSNESTSNESTSNESTSNESTSNESTSNWKWFCWSFTQEGQKVSLTKFNNNLDNILVGLGWDTAQNSSIPYDLDVEVFMLGANDKVVGDDWFVFITNLPALTEA